MRIDDIVVDMGIDLRKELDRAWIKELVDVIDEAVHRTAAATKAGRKVIKGTKETWPSSST